MRAPMFLIISCDVLVSASVHALLVSMCCSEKESVKYASNYFILTDLLRKHDFEFILLDRLEGVSHNDIFVEINKLYKHRKQL